MIRKFLIPKAGRIVRDPSTMTPLPAKGSEKVMNAFWTRRLNAGEVTEGKPEAPKVQPKAQNAEKSKKRKEGDN